MDHAQKWGFTLREAVWYRSRGVTDLDERSYCFVGNGFRKSSRTGTSQETVTFAQIRYYGGSERLVRAVSTRTGWTWDLLWRFAGFH